jgi:hypothetical protein
MHKEDNSLAKVDETLDFKVIEFSKENKKIIVSHTKTFQDRMHQQKDEEKKEEIRQEQTTNKAVKKIKDSLEKTTLGDLSVLADLKEEMIEGEVADAKAKLEEMEKKQKARQTKSKDSEGAEGDAPKASRSKKKKEEAPETSEEEVAETSEEEVEAPEEQAPADEEKPVE